MIALLLWSQVAFEPSPADELSFKPYRICVEQRAGSAALTQTDDQILASAEHLCVIDKRRTLADLKAADRASHAPQISAEYRMEFMSIELTADVIANLVDRRAGAPK